MFLHLAPVKLVPLMVTLTTVMLFFSQIWQMIVTNIIKMQFYIKL